MAHQQKFRSAFNGFHREDVVNYIARLEHDREVQVNGLKNELTILREELAAERKQTALLLAEVNGLREQANEKQAREELELFRQAERAQREAEAQAAVARERAGGILAEALEKAGDTAALAEELARALALLRQGLEEGRQQLAEENP